jgi:hypothetical protein
MVLLLRYARSRIQERLDLIERVDADSLAAHEAADGVLRDFQALVMQLFERAATKVRNVPAARARWLDPDLLAKTVSQPIAELRPVGLGGRQGPPPPFLVTQPPRFLSIASPRRRMSSYFSGLILDTFETPSGICCAVSTSTAPLLT